MILHQFLKPETGDLSPCKGKMTDAIFSDARIERYSRHILLREIGLEGQQKLLAGSTLVIGAGGLGSSAILYLAAAGVGRIGVADHDTVELSNLQRQIIHSTADVGQGKARSAAAAVTALNPDCEVTVIPERVSASNVRAIVRGWNVVLDGSDNFGTRFLVADCCRLEGVPLVSAAAVMWSGQLLVQLPGAGNPCYRCMFREPPPPGLAPSCREAGILGAVVGVMGSLQALEAVKIITGVGEPLSHQLLVYDALSTAFMTVKRAPNPRCPLCGEHPVITSLEEHGEACADLRAPEAAP
jgi:adenylyltransferase/sulfurtransferase